MELNEIKKVLAKHNTRATFVKVSSEGIFFVAIVGETYEDRIGLNFLVPIKELQQFSFYATEEAQNLIRWIVKPEEL